MKKLIVFLLVLLFGAVSAQAADFVFDKGLYWGMPQKDLIRVEKNAGGKVKDKSAETVVVKTQYREHKDVEETFSFVNKELSAAEYTVNYYTNVNNTEMYIEDYEQLVSDLTESYGKPVKAGYNWKITDPTLKGGFESQNKKGLAVSLGYLEAEANWKFEDKNMAVNVLLFSPKGLKAAITVTYTQLQ